MTNVLVFGGRGRYADKWHDYVATTHAVATALSEMGLAVMVSSKAIEALTNLDDVDLLVVNAGRGPVNEGYDGSDADLAAARTGLDAYLDRGGPVACLHMSMTTFWDNPRWKPMIGSDWIDGQSYHPDLGPCVIEAVPDAHPLASGLTDLETIDERYCALALSRPVKPYLVYRHDGTTEPLAWAWRDGSRRMVCNTLGHHHAAYGPARLALLRREVDWLLASGDNNG
jgi:type 1 glutamine amidotransferase